MTFVILTRGSVRWFNEIVCVRLCPIPFTAFKNFLKRRFEKNKQGAECPFPTKDGCNLIFYLLIIEIWIFICLLNFIVIIRNKIII